MLKDLLANIRNFVPMYRELMQIKGMVCALQSQLSDITAVLCQSAIEGHPRYRDPRLLQRYALQVNSQHGEDGIINEIFRRIGTSNRVFVEIGVGDGTENNTAFLLSSGWKGYWLDGRDSFLKTISTRQDLQDGCLKWLIAFVERDNIAQLLTQLDVPKEFDLLSIDIDQNTYFAWEGLRAFRPRVVVIEYNAAIPADVDWKVHYDYKRTWDGSNNYGASLKAFEELGRELGYHLVGCELSGVNAFFVRDDLVTGKFAEPFTSENHHEPPRYVLGRLRQGHPRVILDRQASP